MNEISSLLNSPQRHPRSLLRCDMTVKTAWLFTHQDLESFTSTELASTPDLGPRSFQNWEE